MDSQIIAALIIGIATVLTVVVGWWLNGKKGQPNSSPELEETSKLIVEKPSTPHSSNHSNNESFPTSESEPPVPKKTSAITVKEIVNAVNSAPPFQKPKIAEQYNGLQVDWIGYLREVREDFRDQESVHVNLDVDQDMPIGHRISFAEKIEKFPEIRVLNQGSKIRIIGEIISASGDGLFVQVRPAVIDVLSHA